MQHATFFYAHCTRATEEKTELRGKIASWNLLLKPGSHVRAGHGNGPMGVEAGRIFLHGTCHSHLQFLFSLGVDR